MAGGEIRHQATSKELGPMSSRLPQGVSSHREIHGKRPLGVWCRNGAMAHTAAKKCGKWYRGVVEAAECFMTRWQRDEAESSWLRHTTEDAKSDDRGKNGGGAAVPILLSMNSERNW